MPQVLSVHHLGVFSDCSLTAACRPQQVRERPKYSRSKGKNELPDENYVTRYHNYKYYSPIHGRKVLIERYLTCRRKEMKILWRAETSNIMIETILALMRDMLPDLADPPVGWWPPSMQRFRHLGRCSPIVHEVVVGIQLCSQYQIDQLRNSVNGCGVAVIENYLSFQSFVCFE